MLFWCIIYYPFKSALLQLIQNTTGIKNIDHIVHSSFLDIEDFSSLIEGEDISFNLSCKLDQSVCEGHHAILPLSRTLVSTYNFRNLCLLRQLLDRHILLWFLDVLWVIGSFINSIDSVIVLRLFFFSFRMLLTFCLFWNLIEVELIHHRIQIKDAFHLVVTIGNIFLKSLLPILTRLFFVL